MKVRGYETRPIGFITSGTPWPLTYHGSHICVAGAEGYALPLSLVRFSHPFFTAGKIVEENGASYRSWFSCRLGVGVSVRKPREGKAMLIVDGLSPHAVGATFEDALDACRMRDQGRSEELEDMVARLVVSTQDDFMEFVDEYGGLGVRSYVAVRGEIFLECNGLDTSRINIYRRFMNL